MDFPYASIRVSHGGRAPSYTPLRYPGGKSWLAAHLRIFLRHYSPTIFVDPFCGGGSASLLTVVEERAERVIMTDLDDDLESFWTSALSDDRVLVSRFEEVMSRYDEFNIRDLLPRFLAEDNDCYVDQAVKFLIRNRLHWGGIVDQSFPTEQNFRYLLKPKRAVTDRLRVIHRFRDRIDYRCADGRNLIIENKAASDTVLFVDPPYPRASRRLYRHTHIDLALLFYSLSDASVPFLLTLNHTPTAEKLTAASGFVGVLVDMRTQSNLTKTEMLITRDEVFPTESKQMSLFTGEGV